MMKYRRVHFLLRISILLFLAIFAPSVRSDQTIPTPSPLPQSESIKAQAVSDSEPPADVFITDQGLSSPVVTISAGDTIRWMNQTNQIAQVKSSVVTTIYLPLIFKGGDEVGASNGISSGLSTNSLSSSQDTEFDSGNILPGEIFSYKFEQPGEYSYTLISASDSTNNLNSAATVDGTISVVSTTEGLGPADISFEEPVSGFVAAGTGLNSQPGTIDIDVPEGVTIKKVLLYWSGATPQSNPGDDTIEVSNTSKTEIVTGDLIGGPHFFYADAYFSSFRADITDLNLVGIGSNTLTIDEMSFGTEDNGVGVLVLFDDGFSTASLEIRDGLDLAHFNFPEPRKSTVPQTFSFDPSDFERAADLLFFVGSIGTNRPNSIKITIDGPEIESSTTELVNPLESADGPEWDSLVVPISIPAGASSVTVEVISTNTFNPRGASLAWIATALSISPGEVGTDLADLVITKSAEPNPVTAGENLTYELNVTNDGPSSATGVVVTDNLPSEVSFVSVTPTPECSESGGTVTCNLGDLAANETVVITIEVTVDELATGTLLNTASVTSETNDPTPENNSDDEETTIGDVVSVRATIIDEASDIECDPEDDVPNSVFGDGGLDLDSGPGVNLDPAYEIPSLVWPAGQAQVFNCLFNNEDRDVYWMAPTPFSREVYVGMTTNDEANYDIAIFVDLQDGDGNIALEAVSLLDTQSVNSSGSMASGSMASGSMASGSMASGSMASGSMASGSMASGSMASGSMASGSMASGSMASGSFNSGNVDERAVAHVEAGRTVFIAVLSQAGDYGPEYEMRVDVLNTDEGICTWSPEFPTTITPPALPDGTGKKTGFFINIGRFEATYGTTRTQALLNALQDPLFLNDSTVQGIVVPIEQDSAVAAAYSDWNATDNYCKIAKANGVAEALRNLIIDDYGDLEQIVVVGGPEMIPPHLVMEGPVEISPESTYEVDSQADADSPIRWWLKQNRVQTYDFYVDQNGPFIRYLGNNLYQPEKPIGVLVETPENIIQVINNYNNSGLQPQSCLNTGYLHLTDAAQAIDSLIDLPTQSLISETWTATDVINAFAANPGLVSFNGHFSHWFAEDATRTDVVYAPEIVSNLISNQVGASMGCHTSLNMPNNWVSGAPPNAEGFHPSEDFAEVLLGNGWAAWYGTIPFAYGDDVAFKYTEQIMFNFFKALDASSGGATVGEAYVSSKQEYFEQMAAGDFDIYDVKSIRGAALYGLPFQHVSIPLSVALDTLDPTISPAQKAALLASPDVDPGALVTQSEPVNLPNSTVSLYASNQNFDLEQIDTPRGSYLIKDGGSNADVVVSPGRPLQPLVSVDLSGQPHGATLVTAKYHDLPDFDPVVTVAATETTRIESLLSKNRWFPPSDGLWAVNLLGSTPRLNMIPAQYNTNGRIERVYDSMNVEVYTSNSDSYHPPGIWHPRTTCDGDEVTFEVKVDDADGIQVVNVAYNDTDNSMWKTTDDLDVSPHPDGDGSFLATKTFSLGPGVEYFIQAVDDDGNVNFDTNYGLNHLTCINPPDATNNFVDPGGDTHAIPVDLEIKFGDDDWEPFPGLALLSDDLVSLEGLGTLDVSVCIDGDCTIFISGVDEDGHTILTFNPNFTVQAADEEFPATLTEDTPLTFVKEWWSGSIAVFKQVHTDNSGEICFTLSGSGAGETTSENPQCLPFEGPSNLLFTWDHLPTGDDYAVTEAPPPAPLVGEGLIDEDIILDEGHRHALVRTVLNNSPGLTCDLDLDKQCLVEATEDTICDSKIAATLLRYTGPSVLDTTITIEPHNHKASSVTYEHVDLISGELLAPLGGFTIDARPEDLGPSMTITIKDSSGEIVSSEQHHTSCSVPYVVGQPAPLNDEEQSPNWSVVSFVEKDDEFVTEEQRGDQCVVASGTDVTYLYSLTNTGAPLTDVTVSDDKLGEIGTFETFGAGETEMLSKTTQIDTTTFNVASATGFLAPDLTCSAPTDAVTVTTE